MRNDQELHLLFRARLPIATLPKEFADRLTKAVLDEVAHLRQEPPSIQECPANYLEGSRPFNTLAKPTKPSPLPCTAKAVAFFLLLHFLLWPLVQGCAFPPTATAAHALLSIHGVGIDGHRLNATPAQTKIKQSATPTATIMLSAHSAGRALRLPPLPPIKPQLPILLFRQRTFVSKSRLTHPATPSTEDTLINLHGPPGVTQESPTAITLTVPYEPQTASQDASPVTPPEPTLLPPESPQPESPATATATPTANTPLIKPTVTPTALALSPTPLLSIFEPTTTPIATGEEPAGVATTVPTATPTICLRPWQTNEPTPTDAPTASVPPTATAAP